MVGIGGPHGGSYALGVPVGGLEIDVEFTVVGVAEGYGPVSTDPAALRWRAASSGSTSSVAKCMLPSSSLSIISTVEVECVNDMEGEIDAAEK